MNTKILVNYKLWSEQSGAYGERPPIKARISYLFRRICRGVKLYEGDDGARWVWGQGHSLRLLRGTSAPSGKGVYVWLWVGGVALAAALRLAEPVAFRCVRRCGRAGTNFSLATAERAEIEVTGSGRTAGLGRPGEEGFRTRRQPSYLRQPQMCLLQL